MEQLTLNGNEDGTFTVTSNKLGVEPISFNSRTDVCVSCKQSVAMQRQCKHAICLTGGRFEKEQWMLRSMRRSRMSVSVRGWREHLVEPVAIQLGLVEPQEVPLFDGTTNQGDCVGEEACVDDMSLSAEDDDLHDLSSSRCKPLSNTEFREVMSQVSSFYDGSTDRVKLVAGGMMIKLRDLIVTKGKANSAIEAQGSLEAAVTEIVQLHNSAFANSVNVFHSTRPITVERPSSKLVACAAQQRLKRSNDMHAAQEARNEAMTVVATTARTNKKAKGSKCSFCGLTTGHVVTSCPLRNEHRFNKAGAPFHEHDMNAADDRTQLIIAIEGTMTVSQLYSHPPIGIYGRLGVTSYKCSFIIKEARAPIGGGLSQVGTWSMTQMVFRVNFVGPNGEIDPIMRDKWVTGSVMKDLITPRGHGQRPKPKFAYDHTTSTGPSIRNSARQFEMPLSV